MNSFIPLNILPKKSRIAALLAGAALFCLAAPQLHATLIWQADTTRGTANFENLNIDQPGGTITVASDPLGQYGNVFKYYLPDEPSGFGKERTESKGTVTPSGTYTLQNNTDYYVGWRSMWNPMPINPGWVALFQLHGYGPSGQPAPLVLRCINGDGTVSFQNGVTGGNPEFWKTTFHTNVWQNFVVHVNISADANVGYVEVWYNGVNQALAGGVSVNGVSRLYCQTLDPTSGSYDALKWGVYRSGAMDGTGPATAYMSNAKLGTTYADVDPTGGSTPDFAISATPSSASVLVGNSATYTVTITPTNGFTDTVTLSASGLPTGATASFNPATISGSGTSTLTVTTSGSTPAGTSSISIDGSSTSASHSASVSLAVKDFTLAVSPSSQTVTAGNGTTYTATTTALNGFSDSVSLSVSGLPSGASGSFNPTSISGGGSSTLSISTTTGTTPGTYTLTITGTDGNLSHSTTTTLVVNAPLPPDFTLSASPSSQTVTAGNGTTYTATTTALNGFSGSVALSVSGLPTGASGSFNPTSITGAGSSTLSVSTTTSTAAGTYPLTITGTSGSLTHTASVSLTINAVSTNNFAGVFQIQNEASGLYLNNQGSLTNGSAITQWTSSTSSNLDWTFIATSNSYYQINSAKSGRDAVVQSASTAAGAKIVQWSFGSSGDDQWKPNSNSDGSYTFVNLHSGLVLGDPGSSTSTSTQMDQETSNGGSNQKWKLIKQ